MYIFKRLMSLFITLLVVSVLLFTLMRSIPGGPFDEDKMPLSQETKAKLMAAYGLDKSPVEQYLRYMVRALQFDFGIPYQSPGETVIQLLQRAWPPSLLLGGLGMLLGTPLGMLLGAVAALRRNKPIDYVASGISTLGITIPVYVISLMLMLVFGVWLKWLPTNGWGKPINWILPVVSYSVVPLATFARYTRSAVLDILNKPFVTVLYAKGLPFKTILFKHVLRNAAIPLITVFFPVLIGITTGSIFVEAMFRVPGLGSYFVTSIQKRDYPLEMALILLLTILVGIAYLITDLVYYLLNPRIRIKGVE